MELQEAIAWSFMAWNDEKHSDVKVAEAAIQADGTLAVTHSFTTEPGTAAAGDRSVLAPMPIVTDTGKALFKCDLEK